MAGTVEDGIMITFAPSSSGTVSDDVVEAVEESVERFAISGGPRMIGVDDESVVSELSEVVSLAVVSLATTTGVLVGTTVDIVDDDCCDGCGETVVVSLLSSSLLLSVVSPVSLASESSCANARLMILAKNDRNGRNDVGLELSVELSVDVELVSVSVVLASNVEEGVTQGNVLVDEVRSVEESTSVDDARLVVDEVSSSVLETLSSVDDVIMVVDDGAATYGVSPTCHTRLKVTLVSVPEVEKSDGKKPPQYICVPETLYTAELSAENKELVATVVSGIPWAAVGLSQLPKHVVA